MIYGNAWVVTMDDAGTEHERGWLRVEDGLVRTVVEAGPGELTPAPLWGLTAEIDLDELPGPPYELAVAFQRAIDAEIRIAGVEIGPTRHLTTPTDLVRENFPYLGS